MTKFNRRGQPSKEYLSTLRKPSSTDYDLLVKSCMEAIIAGESDVMIAFTYTFKFPKDFPKGIMERKDGASNHHRIKARKLLTWLHEQGHTFVTVEALRRQRSEFSKIENNFVKLNEIDVDLDLEMVDNINS